VVRCQGSRHCRPDQDDRRLDDGRGGCQGRQAARRATLEQALAALVAKHRAEGLPFDRKAPDIARTWRFLARELAKLRAPRKAKALTDDDLLGILAGLQPLRKADARDGALLALGWGGAPVDGRLDGRSRGGGFVSVGADGITVTLMTSKARRPTRWNRHSKADMPRRSTPSSGRAAEPSRARRCSAPSPRGSGSAPGA
jgi:hypothetical protein